MTMRRSDWLVVLSFLVPPWAALLVGCYWYFLDRDPPLTLVYQHERFLSEPAETKAQAVTLSVDTVPSGAHVWIYREVCMRDGVRPGMVEPYWQAGSFQWAAPQRTWPPKSGCYGRSYGIVAPSTSPSRDFTYLSTVVFENNPLVMSRVELPPMKLRVLAPGDK